MATEELPGYTSIDSGTWKPNTDSNDIDILMISEGKGKYPSEGVSVELQYTGWIHANNKQFITIRQVIHLDQKKNIQGLEMAIKKIKVGSQIKLWIPSNLAYGEKGAGDIIPPNADLLYHLKLLRIVDTITSQRKRILDSIDKMDKLSENQDTQCCIML